MKTHMKITSVEDLIKAILTANEKQADEEIIFEIDKSVKYSLPEAALGESALPTLQNKCKVVIEGNGATLLGTGNGTGLILSGDNITIKNLTFESFQNCVFINASCSSIKNLLIDNCSFIDFQIEGILTGITSDDLEINNVKIKNCCFEGPVFERRGVCCIPVHLISSFFNKRDVSLHNTALRNVEFVGNKIIPNHIDHSQILQGIILSGACNHTFFEGVEWLDDFIESSIHNDVSNSITENILIENNDFDYVFDSCCSLLPVRGAKGDCVLQNVRVKNNRFHYFNTGMGVFASSQVMGGNVKRGHTRNVLIEGNTFIPQVPGPNEPQMAIHLYISRSESHVVNCIDCHMEDIVVRGNNITGRDIGIALEGPHGTLDLPAPSRLANCTVKKITIDNNEFHNIQYPLRVLGAHTEGRTGDFWGYKYNGFDDSLPYSTIVENNSIDEIKVLNNLFDDFDCALVLSAAYACGHSFARGNTVGPDIVFENNTFEKGKKIFNYSKVVSDQIIYDDAIGFDNKVLCNVKVK